MRKTYTNSHGTTVDFTTRRWVMSNRFQCDMLSIKWNRKLAAQCDQQKPSQIIQLLKRRARQQRVPLMMGKLRRPKMLLQTKALTNPQMETEITAQTFSTKDIIHLQQWTVDDRALGRKLIDFCLIIALLLTLTLVSLFVFCRWLHRHRVETMFSLMKRLIEWPPGKLPSLFKLEMDSKIHRN